MITPAEAAKWMRDIGACEVIPSEIVKGCDLNG
jgi:hypothetical protein